MKILAIIDNISIWSGRIFRWSALVLSVVVLFEVIARYVFNSPTIWAFDSAMFTYSVLYLMGGAYVTWEGTHIRVDLLYMRCSERVKAILDAIFLIVFFFPYVFVMTWWGYKATVWSYRAAEISNTSQWGEPIYLWKFLIPLGFFLMLLQGVPELVRTIQRIRRPTNGA